jgi:hypothetical protein
MCCCGSDTVTALLAGKQHHFGGRGHTYPVLFHQHQPPPLRYIIPQAFTTAISDTARMMKMKELALQLREENIMPPMHGEGDGIDDELPQHSNSKSGSTHYTPHSSQQQYDEDCRTPIESEFMGLIAQFLSYTEEDIQSLTTTSHLYQHYCDQQLGQSSQTPTSPRRRSREEGIRYRTIYSGVQAAALEPEVLRAFTILFEDYIPIRLAGRRIYRHLHNVMEEVRKERRGEMERVRYLCPDWEDCIIKADSNDEKGEVTNLLQYGRRVWDTLMDEALLLEHSLESSLDINAGTIQDGGVVSVTELLDLGIDQVLIETGIVNSVAQLEAIVGPAAIREEMDIEHYYNTKKTDGHKDGKYLVMTFPIFMNLLYQCTLSSSSNQSQQDYSYILDVLRKIEQKVLDHRITISGVDADHDVSSLLAAKAVHSGSSVRCAKREKFSNRFDEYVSTFQLWERRFLSGGDNSQKHVLSRRFEILRGCFVGARNRRNVAALKIVYMDYNALRIAGDLIFQLMTKLTNKLT